MYEQAEVPVFRRIAWIVLWAIVLLAVLWLLVWLIFFHHSTPKVTSSTNQQNHSASNQAPSQSSTTHQSGTSSSNKSAPTQPTNGTTNGAQSSPSAPNTPSQTAPVANSTPQGSNDMPNTGAGNIFIPFGLATVVGTVIYYVRMHRKLSTKS